MSVNGLPIDHSEAFPNLARAPIVEAVLHWQAITSKDFKEADLLNLMQHDFPEYSSTNQHNLEAGFAGTPEGIEFKQRSAWQGVRLTRKHDGGSDKFVCQFLRQGVVFSQLAPYTNWVEFVSEAKKFLGKVLRTGGS